MNLLVTSDYLEYGPQEGSRMVDALADKVYLTLPSTETTVSAPLPEDSVANKM